MSEFVSAFKNIDLTLFPNIDHYPRPIERSLWTLCILKDLAGIKSMTALQISEVLREGLEIHLPETSIINSLKRAGERIYVNNKNGVSQYEIMALGREYVMSMKKSEMTSLFYFEPEKRYSSKRVLSNNILQNLKGIMRIVDPYIGTRTLDILSSVKNEVKFLTRMNLLKKSQKERMKREILEYKSEHKNIEIRNYGGTDIHDRYVLSDDFLVLLGHGFKDLGNKESFALLLNKNDSVNVYEAMLANFNRRWKKAVII